MSEEAINQINNRLDETYHWIIDELRQENQQLKEQLEKKYKEVGTLTNEILYEENTKLLSVLDEIREQLKLERKLALSLNKPYTVSVIDKLLDKVKE